MFKKFLLTVLMSATSFLIALQNPADFMQQVTADVLVDLNSLSIQKKDQVLYDIINKKILPEVDIGYMARWVVGRKAWMEASAEQQKKFTEVFTTLLCRTYSSTLLIFKDRTMKYYQVGQTDYRQAQRVQVICEIQQPNKDPIKALYQLHAVNQEWKIFDVVVEGISMLKGLQAQFTEVITRGGIDGATKLIQQKIEDQHHAD
jgi:ABC-type transporter MlaC component